MTQPFQIVPAIDLRAGQLVRLEQGDYERETVYDADPAAPARRFVAEGAERIHVVDLDGARDGQSVNEPAVRQILEAAGSLPVQLGGGIRSLERVRQLLQMGLDRVILGTALLEDPGLVEAAAGEFPGRVILGLDARDGKLAVRGWRETAEVEVHEVMERFAQLPIGAIVYTDISRDGMLQGPNVSATEKLARQSPFPVLASGGVSGPADLVALAQTRVIAGAIVGRALYTGKLELPDALRQVAQS